MIHTIQEEISIIIYLILFGIYLVSTYDLILQIEKWLKFKKIKTYLLEIIFNILQILITIRFSSKIANGYIPVYFILFFIIGVVIYYYTSRKLFIKQIRKSLDFYKSKEPKIKKFFKECIYSEEIAKNVKKNLKRYKKIFTKTPKENDVSSDK